MSSPISKKEILQLAQELVQSPSVNPPGETRECAEIVSNKLKKDKIDVQIIEGKKGASNVVARLQGKRSGKVLLLNGHLDVVPPGADWTGDPFSGEIRDNKIYGRGTCDMKSGIASMIAAMIGFKRSGIPFNGEILFMGVADEETGSEFGTVYLLQNNIGSNADFAIVGEPTSMRVELGNRGLRWIDVTFRGRSCHAGRPQLGINPIVYAAKFIEAIQSMKFGNRNDAFEISSPTIAVTMVKGGSKINVIPERCDLSIDRRMLPGEKTETVMDELQRMLDPILEEEKGPHAEMKVRPAHWDPYLISRDEQVAQATIKSFKRVTGREPEILAKSACTDGSHLFHLRGIPAVIFGPGNEYLSHKADECVEIEDIVLATHIYISIFNELLGLS